MHSESSLTHLRPPILRPVDVSTAGRSLLQACAPAAALLVGHFFATHPYQAALHVFSKWEHVLSMDSSIYAPLYDPDVQTFMDLRARAVRNLRVFFNCTDQTFERLLLVALLIDILSGDFDVALHFLMTKSARPAPSTIATFEFTVRELWTRLLDDETFAMACALEICFSQGQCRLQAEIFIMEAILVGRIMDASRRGLVLPLQAVIDAYIGLWTRRSVPDAYLPTLTRLSHHANARRKFGVRLRTTWNLHVGGLQTLTCVDEQTAKQKVHHS